MHGVNPKPGHPVVKLRQLLELKSLVLAIRHLNVPRRELRERLWHGAGRPPSTQRPHDLPRFILQFHCETVQVPCASCLSVIRELGGTEDVLRLYEVEHTPTDDLSYFAWCGSSQDLSWLNNHRIGILGGVGFQFFKELHRLSCILELFHEAVFGHMQIHWTRTSPLTDLDL
eukprot:CAMPEP_0194524666 /NCGR_PEP_ID=MMETSP0253-20130528/59920_1 /TAXON_ID=2966 /ORGANISM="Noctiluca scintillans" /LENGTH=171 /DNA_ID=CAMNT_0039369323 /DNA_START=164 /DNA_END=679 /DNA_ORIENTATION=+